MINEDSPSMEDAIESVVDRVMSGVSTFFPATITSVKRSPVNTNTVIVDVVSNFLNIDPETNTTSPKAIQNVSLMMVGRTNTFILRPPLDNASLVGASVGLLVSDTYLANWKKTGGQVIPTDSRRFHYADAVALFGLCPDVICWPTAPKENTAQVKVATGTFLEIGNSTTDIPRLLADLLNILSTATAAGGGAALTLLPSAISGKSLAQLITEFSTLYNPDTTP